MLFSFTLPGVKLKSVTILYKQNIQTECVNTVSFKLHQIKRQAVFFGHQVFLNIYKIGKRDLFIFIAFGVTSFSLSNCLGLVLP